MIADILLHLDSYPEPTSAQAIDQAVAFCAGVEGRVTGLATLIDLRVQPNWLAKVTAGIDKLIREEETRSRDACRSALDHFTTAAKAAGAFSGAETIIADYTAVGEAVAKAARCRDFCIVPITAEDDGQRSVAADVVFGSGKGTLVFQAGAGGLPQGAPRTAVLAWDGSRCAARAMGEALPVLRRAGKVVVLSVLNEKVSVRAGAGADAARHLRAYGVDASVAEMDGTGRSIGRSLDDYCSSVGADLLVMGAYGRSRVEEFILGGATEHVLKRPKIAVFLAH